MMQNVQTLVIIWVNVAFHHAQMVFKSKDDVTFPLTLHHSLTPYRNCFPQGDGRYIDDHHDQMSFLNAMNAACQDISAEHCQGWIRH